MEYVQTPITVFCDANTILNRSAIKRIVRHYTCQSTGGVAGEKRVIINENTEGSLVGEGLYWKYESLLKRLDARLYKVNGAAGELFSIRTSLWSPLPKEVILDDFVISARVNIQGYRIAYEPESYAMELPSASLREEKKRKVRISAGAFQAMILLKPLFNCFKYPVLFFQFFSHRFLRWTLTPLCFSLLLLSNIWLVIVGKQSFYTWILIMQTVFYLTAFIGGYLRTNTGILKILRVCNYIIFMNYSVYLGFARFILGKQSAVWEKAGREVLVATDI
jgi:cellulose synthase/poly-beta-1,6-N-acetylglucosamine synthase-like glycosyltransferase